MEEGLVLKLKKGYNPNSSSVGSQIPNIIYLSASAGVISVFISAYFSEFKKNIINKTENNDREIKK